jgi:hypothetical protein
VTGFRAHPFLTETELFLPGGGYPSWNLRYFPQPQKPQGKGGILTIKGRHLIRLLQSCNTETGKTKKHETKLLLTGGGDWNQIRRQQKRVGFFQYIPFTLMAVQI